MQSSVRRTKCVGFSGTISRRRGVAGEADDAIAAYKKKPHIVTDGALRSNRRPANWDNIYDAIPVESHVCGKLWQVCGSEHWKKYC